ncbi:MAG: hypothetical protein U5N21_14310 [Rhodococcus sp. (in: high G+C Gram-positive bacteria)]|uniref:hypothetical protein n=1 Tax=Rhodococcus sp. TaxID=1831 RepID=UPI002AD83EE4|nr:hypothetical protein [Rhodococcus sp. (in: high G+C Gram-positive bacteria)]MDZ7931148.1 hypothetical protein [Rhodococcus sp. (in: high G+C Gram-positive bacteria)]
MKLSRAALLLSTLVFIGALIWVGVTAGDQVPAHFDGSGQVDRMETKLSFLLTMGGVGFAMIVLFASIGWWFPKVPATMVNLPSRTMHEYWTAAENRPELNRKMAEDLEWIGAATALLFAWITGVAGATTGGSVSMWVLAVPTAIYMLSILGYVVFVVKGGRYRVPKD